ncbi:hypothetical protein HK103_000950 [Boothiomyces macroporosus]|uniref:mRNA export factor GLE1 n=1 Tax=Boothiomyces macroporosus TaxID=261099 RepID=A0AAD5UK54_9FUNG|nr:hypothetical protein HK103_000950 [Boothiomyces macroporosus]
MKKELQQSLDVIKKMELEEQKRLKEIREEKERKEKEVAEKQRLEKEKKQREEKEKLEKEKAEKDKLEKERIEKEKQEHQLKLKQEAPKISIQNSSITPKHATPIKGEGEQSDKIVSKQAWEEASTYLEIVNKIKTELKPKMLQNVEVSNELMKCKMKINRTVGQLTRSQSQLIRLAKSLNEIFNGAKEKSLEFHQVVMYLAAKKIIKQAETEVSVKNDTAYPLAILCVHLGTKHPEFWHVLLGRFMKKCIFIIPCYLVKPKAESLQVYQERLGFKKNETEIQYGERMCGIVALYAAVVQTDAIPNSYGIQHGWSWMARILNMKPRKLTPLLILTFLEIAGNKLLQQYGEQGKKLVHLIIEKSIPMMPASSVASTTKLKLFLEDTVFKQGTIPAHPSRVLLNE